MLDAGLKTQLSTYLQNLRQPIELVASLDGSAGSNEMRALLEDVASTSDKVSLNFSGDNARKPSFAITRAAGDADVGLEVLAVFPEGGKGLWVGHVAVGVGSVDEAGGLAHGRWPPCLVSCHSRRTCGA